MKKFRKASDIKVGVVGYGPAFQMGKVHLTDMQNAGMTPVAVTELDAARRAAAEKEFPGIRTYASTAEMLRKSDVDLVAVLTPHNAHAPIAVECLKAGRHVVCEKPFAITTQECDVMIREAKRRGLVVSAFHNRHWDGCILEAVKRIVKNREIGDVYRIDASMGTWSQPGDWWRSSKSISGGVLYDWGAHLIEYSLQLIDSAMVEVTGFAKTGYWVRKTKWGKDTNEDEACATVRFANGAWLTVRVSHLDLTQRRGMLAIAGTEGSYIMDHGEYEVIQRHDGRTVSTKGANPKAEWRRYYENIAGHLMGKARLVITPEWARRPIHVLDLACRSAQVGHSLRVKYG